VAKMVKMYLHDKMCNVIKIAKFVTIVEFVPILEYKIKRGYILDSFDFK
jgi:hypothetical protein